MSSSTQQKTTLETSCHCGAMTISAPQLPPYLNECQCSICRRYGAQWAYYQVQDIQINGQPAIISGPDLKDTTTSGYMWVDKSSSFDCCKACGCVMYWFPVDAKEGEAKMGINARVVTDPFSLRFVEKRITYQDAIIVKEGVYDENGPVRK
ncbi:Putative CENP-V/GFA domain, Mss4-like superfamily protein [Septoria linicola]|uniref:CENP-V/GFA domain, Mss4-like superfamily protein n=1 Tax=Septoria linicola TaxID=215465 RepID=A0A9Q9AYS0_9PEZI|nr:Putative CENP-V/GFA domain, Mss4-like superfamily protein [Septoria linicola]